MGKKKSSTITHKDNNHILQSLKSLRDVKGSWLLPSESLLTSSTKVTHRRGLGVDWSSQVQLLDDVVWAKLEVGVDDLFY